MIDFCDADRCPAAGCEPALCRGLGLADNVEVFERSSRVIPGGVSSPVRAFRAVGGTPYAVVRGEGPYVWDVEGNRYIDLVQSYGALILGHAHPAVVAAIRAAAADGTTLRRAHRRRDEDGRGDHAVRTELRVGAAREQRYRSHDDGGARGAGVHRPRQGHQVRGQLPRARRLTPRRGRQRRRGARSVGFRRRPRQRGGGHGRCPLQRACPRSTPTSPQSSSSRWRPTWAWSARRPGSSKGCAPRATARAPS